VGCSGPVRQFSDPHLAAPAVLVLGSSGAVIVGHRYPGRPTRLLSWALAALILAIQRRDRRYRGRALAS
jgi:hypothetical protein